jgi:serine/threonine-protein kinase
MNSGLERRVQAQVSEIVERARQIEQLNAQLQAQVRARSTELSMALARLARDRDAGGRLRKGVVLGGRFVIDELLGEGGMGSVYSGTDRSTKDRVAIKVIQASSAQQLDALHRFLREAGTAATVTHPAVVRMLHVDVSDDGMLFQVQELVEGETLFHRLGGDAPWEVERVARLGAVLCDALAAAHAKGIVHRDVKPGNIMVTRTAPGLKLLDFGISKLLPGRGRDSSSGSGAIIGTPGYMAPEQLSGSSKLTDRADVYAVGVILFRMLTGQLPFDEESLKAIVLRHVVGSAPDARAFAPDLAPEVAELVARCLDMSPAARPRAQDVASSLGAFADAGGAPALEVVIRDGSRKLAARVASEAETVAGKRTPTG